MKKVSELSSFFENKISYALLKNNIHFSVSWPRTQVLLEHCSVCFLDEKIGNVILSISEKYYFKIVMFNGNNFCYSNTEN